MLTLTPKNSISWDFHVMENGVAVAFIDRHWFHERGSFSVDGTDYDVRRTSRLRGTFVLEQSGTVLAEAKKTSSFRRVFAVSVGAEAYSLRAASSFGRQFDLLRDGAAVGAVRPTSMLRRTVTVELPDALSRPVQLFMAFLVLVLWKRRYDAAGA